MKLHPPKAAESLFWTPGVALFEWCKLGRLRGYFSPGTDHFTEWVKHDTLGTSCGWCSKSCRRLSRSIRKEACYIFSGKQCQQKFSNRSPVQKRLSILNWNPGPRRGKDDAFKKQIAGKGHVITLHEAAEYFNHYILICRFKVTHFACSAALFNKDTFYSNIDSRSRSFGFFDWSISSCTEQNKWTQERAMETHSAVIKPNLDNPIPIKHTNVIIDHNSSNTTHSDPISMLYVLTTMRQ